MRRGSQTRLRVETLIAIVAFGLGVVTVVWPDWIERILRVDPDGGSGSLEWAIVLSLFAVSLVSSLLANRERRHLRLASRTSA